MCTYINVKNTLKAKISPWTNQNFAVKLLDLYCIQPDENFNLLFANWAPNGTDLGHAAHVIYIMLARHLTMATENQPWSIKWINVLLILLSFTFNSCMVVFYFLFFSGQQIVFYVFSPSLVVSTLAETITFESLVTL